MFFCSSIFTSVGSKFSIPRRNTCLSALQALIFHILLPRHIHPPRQLYRLYNILPLITHIRLSWQPYPPIAVQICLLRHIFTFHGINPSLMAHIHFLWQLYLPLMATKSSSTRHVAFHIKHIHFLHPYRLAWQTNSPSTAHMCLHITVFYDKHIYLLGTYSPTITHLCHSWHIFVLDGTKLINQWQLWYDETRPHSGVYFWNTPNKGWNN